MDNPGYTSLTRLSGLMREMQVVANNIANISTTGFRAEGLIFAEHIAETGRNEPSLSMGTAVGRSISAQQGALQRTGGEFDFAIEGTSTSRATSLCSAESRPISGERSASAPTLDRAATSRSSVIATSSSGSGPSLFIGDSRRDGSRGRRILFVSQAPTGPGQRQPPPGDAGLHARRRTRTP